VGNRPDQPARAALGHLDEVRSLRFAADGRLISASKDGTVSLWRVGKGAFTQPAFSLQWGN